MPKKIEKEIINDIEVIEKTVQQPEPKVDVDSVVNDSRRVKISVV